jgi:hypothetical protein
MNIQDMISSKDLNVFLVGSDRYCNAIVVESVIPSGKWRAYFLNDAFVPIERSMTVVVDDEFRRCIEWRFAFERPVVWTTARRAHVFFERVQ